VAYFDHRLWLLTALVFVAAMSLARAQDVTGVPNADVNPGYHALAYRVAYAPPGSGDPSSFVQQVSYQRNLSDRWSIQVGANFGRHGPEPVEFKAIQTIVQWQFAESERTGVDGSLIVITKIPDSGDSPGRVSTALAGKWNFLEDWEARAGLAGSVEYGAGGHDGVSLGARSEVTRRVGTLMRVGVQLANGFNTIGKFGPFKTQGHQAGVVAKGPILGDLTFTATALFGLTDVAPDQEFKLFLTYEL
jgi:hypothetical protein